MGNRRPCNSFCVGPQSFITFRVITGLGLGAELPVAFTLLAELVPAGRRARLTGWIVLSGAAGGVIFNLLALGAVAIFGPNIGWRVMFGIMFLIAALAMYVRRSFPESPRWFESRADHDRADQAMKMIEQNVERAYGQPLPEPVPAPEPDVIEEDHTRPRFRELFTEGHLWRTLFSWTLWLVALFPYYGIGTWVGKLLVDRGMSVSGSLLVGILIGLAGIPAALVAGQVMDRYGRKITLIASLVLVSVAALAYGNASEFWLVVTFGACMQFGLIALATALNTYTPELFATRVRGSGVGTSQTLGRIAAIFSPILIPVIVVNLGYTGTFIVFAVLFGIGAVLTLVFGPESKGQTIESLSH